MKYKEIGKEIYHGYGFNRQELVDFFDFIGKNVNLGIPPMNFINSDEDGKASSKEDLENEISRLNDILETEISKQPNILGKYRSDDPLLIAIKIRNAEWLTYNEDDRTTAPTADYLIEKLKQDYKMSDALARAIEKVACPIVRK